MNKEIEKAIIVATMLGSLLDEHDYIDEEKSSCIRELKSNIKAFVSAAAKRSKKRYLSSVMKAHNIWSECIKRYQGKDKAMLSEYLVLEIGTTYAQTYGKFYGVTEPLLLQYGIAYDNKVSNIQSNLLRKYEKDSNDIATCLLNGMRKITKVKSDRYKIKAQ